MPFRGLIAYPITPMDCQGRVDLPAFRVLLRRLVDAGVDGICAVSSTGGFAYLSREERQRAFEVAVAEADGHIPVLAGISAMRTDEAVRLANDAREAGVEGGLLTPMCYTPLTEEEVYRHFKAVSEASDLPLCVYNNPATTHFSFTTDLIVRLSRLHNVIAVKTPAPEKALAARSVGELRTRMPDGFSIGYGTDWYAIEALIAGGDAWHSVAAGLFPEICSRISKAVSAGEHDKARRLGGAMEPLWDTFKAFGSIRVMYAAAKRMGLWSFDPPRPILPLEAASAEQIDALAERLSDAVASVAA